MQLNTQAAVKSDQLAGQTSRIAQDGGMVVGQFVHPMKFIHESSTRIADIIGMIDGIAFQTNIPAVQAARAGEQGRGFAVEASEVHSLAGRSAEAAKEIKRLISTAISRLNQTTQQNAALVEEMAAAASSLNAQAHELVQAVSEFKFNASDFQPQPPGLLN